MPSYSRCATDIVRFGLNASLRLASCWRVDVVNGGAGERFWGADRDLADDRRRGSQRGDVALGRGLVGDRQGLAVDAHELGAKVSPAAVARIASSVQYSRAVKARDLAFALDDEADGDRLHASGRQAAADLARQQRAERVADQAVDDPARLLRVHEVAGRCRAGSRRRRGSASSVISLKVTRRVFSSGTWAASATCQAIASPSRSRSVARYTRSDAAGGLLDVADLLAAVVADHVLGREVVVDVDAELALAGVLGQVADVAVGGQNAVVRPEIALDGPGLGG